MLSTSTHVFSQLLVHLNWHCKDDKPCIQGDLEKALYGYIESYCRKTKGIRFEGLGGTETHVHLAVQIEPFISISDWVGKLKGGSAHEMNEKFGRGSLQWQRGYGVVSFAKRDLPSVLKYVKNQKEHHRMGKLNRVLEFYGEPDGGRED
ncbi:IS200/IS605 family transposase [Candidatus Sumerlaeota bacterium]|nr:IS200/IS605 family transposase [Candidatus Sumerlaeota bacterium]